MQNVTASADVFVPRAFVSYAWGGDDFNAWVLQLATRLVKNGVDVVLDRWDAALGADLPLFMEQGINSATRVLVIATPLYAEKADAARGGVGYERRLLTPGIIKDLGSDRIITIVRDNPDRVLPRFLGLPIYLDFRDDADYEPRYAELIHSLHGRAIVPRPALGSSPFATVAPEDIEFTLRNEPARYASPDWFGAVTFDHSNNSGNYVIGAGDMAFTLSTSESGQGSVYVYRDPADISTVALATGIDKPSAVGDASIYDASSRSREIREGDAAILRNVHGYWAVVCVDEVHNRDSSPTGHPSMTFRYAIQRDHTSTFATIHS